MRMTTDLQIHQTKLTGLKGERNKSTKLHGRSLANIKEKTSILNKLFQKMFQSFYDASMTSILKLDKSLTRKQQALSYTNILDAKNPQILANLIHTR